MPNPQQPQSQPPDVETNFTSNPTTTDNYKRLDQNSGLFVRPADMYCNHSNRECVTGVWKVSPTYIDDLKQYILDSRSKNRNIRAVGHGCSYSDISLVDKGTIVDTDALDSIDNDWNESFLLDPTQQGKYVSIKAGTHVSELNILLDSQGKAMKVLGGADVQTVGGIISTATHGTGYTFKAIGEYVRSIVLVNEDGKVYRIEKSSSRITDDTKYHSTYGAVLKMDDDFFNAVLVNMGSMGIIYSVVIEVEPAYRLYENRYITNWGDIKGSLFNNVDVLKAFRHVEFAVNPYTEDPTDTAFDKNVACITKIDITDEEPRCNTSNRNFLYNLGGDLNSSPEVVYGIMKANPEKIPATLSFALKQMEDNKDMAGGGYINKSYNVFNKRLGSLVEKGIGIEVVVKWNNKRIGKTGADVLEAVMQKVKDLSKGFDKTQNGMFLTAPIAVRFVRASSTYLSMFYADPTATSDDDTLFMVMEIPVISFEKLINDDSSYKKDVEILVELQSFLTANYDTYNARVHWGLSFKEQLTEIYAKNAYPKYEDFKRVYQALNPKSGFQNNFTTRLGLDFPLDTPHQDLINTISFLSDNDRVAMAGGIIAP